MTIDIPHVLLVLGALLAVLFLIHRFAPTSVVGQAETKALNVVDTAAAKIEPALEAEGIKALTAAELWLTDDTAANAKLAQAARLTSEANAEKATRVAALRQHIATLTAKLPATS